MLDLNEKRNPIGFRQWVKSYSTAGIVGRVIYKPKALETEARKNKSYTVG